MHANAMRERMARKWNWRLDMKSESIDEVHDDGAEMCASIVLYDYLRELRRVASMAHLFSDVPYDDNLKNAIRLIDIACAALPYRRPDSEEAIELSMIHWLTNNMEFNHVEMNSYWNDLIVEFMRHVRDFNRTLLAQYGANLPQSITNYVALHMDQACLYLVRYERVNHLEDKYKRSIWDNYIAQSDTNDTELTEEKDGHSHITRENLDSPRVITMDKDTIGRQYGRNDTMTDTITYINSDTVAAHTHGTMMDPDRADALADARRYLDLAVSKLKAARKICDTNPLENAARRLDEAMEWLDEDGHDSYE